MWNKKPVTTKAEPWVGTPPHEKHDFESKNGGLGHVTINFDSVLRRLLTNTTETNSTLNCIIAVTAT